jgi:hypothetical protein
MNLKNIFLFLFAGLMLKGINSRAQESDYFIQMEDSLKILSFKIVEPIHDFERLSVNNDFKDLFLKVLEKEGSFDYPFDSLSNVSLLKAPDNSFRIITWYVPLPESSFEYFGFFQVKDERRGDVVIYPLMNVEREPDDLLYQQFSPESWYGAYYYQLIHNRHEREDYYTLLGWRSDNLLTRKRVIEPIRTAARGKPVFGIPQFTYENNRYRRVVFEYSAKVSMSVIYDRQLLKGSRRPKNMIVFDRLMPTHPQLKGHYQFYFPETNVFDAFVFENGRWVYYPGIDARNPEKENKK